MEKILTPELIYTVLALLLTNIVSLIIPSPFFSTAKQAFKKVKKIFVDKKVDTDEARELLLAAAKAVNWKK